ncbi:hypothetical protein BpHYR1_048642 [Brachionus plicatilis]|uniref:Uncharacterized protein n=1 Tax=Brachionus plicatilis TaxID=10195 RepID=A0A3M7R735_BRAPC|nr:hypothetical protein BpHYR1_048642 [Brachionus plicatilis]
MFYMLSNLLNEILNLLTCFLLMVNEWNALPASVVNATSVNQFKNRYDAFRSCTQTTCFISLCAMSYHRRPLIPNTRPNTICIIPIITENFILSPFVNVILFVANCHTGSTPNGYGEPEILTEDVDAEHGHQEHNIATTEEQLHYFISFDGFFKIVFFFDEVGGRQKHQKAMACVTKHNTEQKGERDHIKWSRIYLAIAWHTVRIYNILKTRRELVNTIECRWRFFEVLRFARSKTTALSEFQQTDFKILICILENLEKIAQSHLQNGVFKSH